ncbi:MAG: hypothetical protein AMXMBFR56_55410 [Polyangiaceae bacterium]
MNTATISEPITADGTVAVQVRIRPDENERLEAVAKKLGCTKATVLRFLIRNSESLAVTFDNQQERA